MNQYGDVLSVAAAATAIVCDRLLPDPPSRWHPVAWMGTTIGWAARFCPAEGRLTPLLMGASIILFGISGWFGIGWLIEQAVNALLPVVGILATGFVLRYMLAVDGLIRASQLIQQALSAGDLGEARRLLGWHLVSRDTSELDEPRVVAATIESVAENSSDSVVAPLFWFMVGGLPLAFAYRFLNTADALLGYRDRPREWLGKVPARMDDLSNLVPARLTALLMLSVGGLLTGRLVEATRIWWRDCRLPESPNAGHPMAASAGVLGVELEKIGAYRLGLGQRLPTVEDLPRMNRLLHWTVIACLVLTAFWGFGTSLC